MHERKQERQAERDEDVDVMVDPQGRHHQGAQRVHRGDRQIELSGDHQDRDAQSDDAELDGACQDRTGGRRSQEMRRQRGEHGGDDKPGEEDAEFLNDEQSGRRRP